MQSENLGQWSSHWFKAFAITGATIGIAGLAPFMAVWLYGFGVLASAAFGAPLLGGRWAGFLPVVVSLRQSFFLAFYPLSYWQVSRVILKINLIRLLAWFVLLSPAIVVIAWRSGFGIFEGFELSLGILLVAIGEQFGIIVLKHSKGTNDTKVFTLLALLFWISVFISLSLAAATVVLFFESPPHGPILGGLIITAVLVFNWFFYGLLYSRGGIDLMHDPDLT